MEKENYRLKLELAQDFIQYTAKNIFLTGRAGTGKTTFLHRIKDLSPKRMIVVAPTGVAAINAGGVTIHSFFQIPFGPWVPGYEAKEKLQAMRFSREKRNIIKSLDLLIIDEISMVRADLLDSVDEVLRKFRRSNEPFGGVQLLLIGDMQQLPPVTKDDEWELLQKHYDTPFFFSSLALRKTDYTTILLEHVFRQRDQVFIEILNKIRDNQVGDKEMEVLERRYQPGFEGDNENYIILTTHNARARRINDNKLRALDTETVFFKAEVDGNFPDYNFPTDEKLALRKGAQVMFIKNDPESEKNYYNGKIGVVTGFKNDGVMVKCPEDEEPLLAPYIEWQNIKYSIDEDSKEISESIEGTFRQVPLKLAWAITIHKSQGLTFDKVIIDSESAFAHGQVYVALSRCRSLEGVVLSTPFSRGSLRTDSNISGFNDYVVRHQADHKDLAKARIKFQQQLIFDLFTFDLLESLLFRYLRILKENQRSLTPGLSMTLEGYNLQFRREVQGVSNRFRKQVEKHLNTVEDIEKNRELQERIKKAVAYFVPKLTDIIHEKLGSMTIDTDNREIRRMVTTAEENVMSEYLFKVACLQACRDGFDMKKYLKEKAVASLEKPGSRKNKRKARRQVSDEIHNKDLYGVLKKWRDIRSQELGLPHYMILPVKALRDLSNVVPKSEVELKQVHGIGKKRLERYGSELLELIRQFIDGHEVNLVESTVSSKPKKSPRKDTRLSSLELWRSGKSIEEVAAERQLAVSTVEGHLAHFVGKGELDARDFVDPVKFKMIVSFFEEQGDMPLTAARDHLGDDITYSDLKFVREHLISKGRGIADT